MTTKSIKEIEFVASTGFVIQNGDWIPIALATCYDTLSQINMIDSSMVPDILPEGWTWIHTAGRVIGAGATTTRTRGEIVINAFRLTRHGETFPLRCTVLDLPRGAQLVIGAGKMMTQKTGITVDLPRFRTYAHDYNEVVRMDWLPRVINRLKSSSIDILSICGGLEPQISTLEELGFTVKTCYSIENNSTARSIASCIHRNISYLPEKNVIWTQLDSIPDKTFYAVFCSPPYRRRKGSNQYYIEDNPEMESALDIASHVLGLDPQTNIYFEVPSKEAADRVSTRLMTTSILSNDIDTVSPMIQERWICTHNIQQSSSMTVTDPSTVLDNGWHPKAYPLRNMRPTSNKGPTLIQEYTGIERDATPDERDRMRGVKAGYTEAFGLFPTDTETRNHGNFNMFSADVLWAVCRQWDSSSYDTIPHSLMTMSDIYAADPAKLELYYMNMGEGKDRYEAILKHLFEYAATYGETNPDGTLIMPKLVLVPEAHQTVPHQIADYADVPPKLAVAAEYKVDQMIRDGTHKRVNYHAEYWISRLFFQAKGKKVTAETDGNHYKAGDEIEAVRPLSDQRPVNAAMAKALPPQWGEHSPDRFTDKDRIPVESTYFKGHDGKDAYHAVLIAEESRKYCVMMCRLFGDDLVILMALCGTQGLAPMGTFYPVWVRGGYCFFFGLAWMQWWIQHVDDGLAHGPDEARCQLRWELMVASQHVMGITASKKQAYSVDTFANHVGLRFSQNGIQISDEVVETIIEVLQQRPKGLKEAQRLRGVIMSSSTAFHFEPDEKLTFSQIMEPINAAITLAQTNQTRFVWTEECNESVKAIQTRFKNQPRRSSDPKWVCSDDRCLVGQADADPKSISWHLISVAKADASTVTPADLMNPELAVLLQVCPKVLSTSQRKWHIFELEMFAQVHGIRKCGKFINESLAPYHDSKTPKYAWCSDSQITLGRIPALTIPDCKLDYLSAKHQRFLGWADETQITRYWPSTRLHAPDADNNLADALARMSHQIWMRMPETTAIEAPDQEDETIDDSTGRTRAALPVSIYTYDREDTSQSTIDPETIAYGMPLDLPSGRTSYTPILSTSEWRLIEQAYTNQSEQYNGVMISDMFNVIHDVDSTCSNATSGRVKKWKDQLFFSIKIKPCDDGPPPRVIYTLSTCTRDADPSVPKTEPSLVLYIPPGVPVRISHLLPNEQPFVSGEQDWQQWHLREDFIWIAHNAQTPHTPLHETIRKIKAQVWWPGLETQVRRWYDSCSLCLPHRKGLAVIGMGLQNSIRFKVVAMDDKILSPEVQAATGYSSILCFHEYATGTMVYAPRRTKLAREVYMLLYTRWVSYYGVMQTLISDLDPAYVGRVAKMICKTLGIENKIECALSNHVSHVEAKINYLSQVIDAAEAKGSLQNADQLLCYVAQAQIRANQLTRTDNATAFERCHGVRPTTVADIQDANKMTLHQIQQAIHGMDSNDADFIRMIQDRCNEIIAHHNVEADSRSRYNMANRLSHNANANRTDYGFTIGQPVSWGDLPYTISEYGDTPVNVQIVDGHGATKWVLAEELRPLAAERMENTLPFSQDIQVTDLVFYCDDQEAQGDIIAGIVKTIDESPTDDATIEVHVHQPKQGAKTWLPLWKDPDNENKNVRKKRCPDGYEPYTQNIRMSQIITTGSFSGPGYALTDSTIYHLASLNIDSRPNG
jgi:hypothetical protein